MWIGNCIVGALLLALNLRAFVLMGVDKRRARRDQWRISEKKLLLSALCFGGLGAFAGMKLFHHKTLHKRFSFGIPAMLIAQSAIIIWAIARQIT